MHDAGPATAAAPWPAQRPAERRRPRLLVRLVPVGLLAPAVVMVTGFFVSSMLLSLHMTYSEQYVGGKTVEGFTLANYTQFLTQPHYWSVLGTTFRLALVTTVITALVGYPVAYAINEIKRPSLRGVAYFLLFAPLLTSVVVRSYGWMLLLGTNGFINTLLMTLKIVDSPISILFQFPAVVISLVHILLPFMVFPIVGSLGQVPPALKEAAADLGARDWTTFTRVTLPLTIQGVVVGCQLVFALSASTFASPSLLGGGRVQVLSALVFSDVGQLNWPMAAVEAWVMLVFALLVIVSFRLLGRVVSRGSA